MSEKKIAVVGDYPSSSLSAILAFLGIGLRFSPVALHRELPSFRRNRGSEFPDHVHNAALKAAQEKRARKAEKRLKALES